MRLLYRRYKEFILILQLLRRQMHTSLFLHRAPSNSETGPLSLLYSLSANYIQHQADFAHRCGLYRGLPPQLITLLTLSKVYIIFCFFPRDSRLSWCFCSQRNCVKTNEYIRARWASLTLTWSAVLVLFQPDYFRRISDWDLGTIALLY